MTTDEAKRLVETPLKFGKAMWPGSTFYGQQREVINSVRDAWETYVVAGNQLGKDYVTGFIALSFFLRPQMYFSRKYVRSVAVQKEKGSKFPHTRRVITTSVKDDHIDVLWGEIGRFVIDCAQPLLASKGGPLIVNHHEIRFAWEMEAANPLNYLKGMVSKTDEGLSGHHAAYTLFIGDEASGIDDSAYKAAQGWAKKYLFIGNPNPCVNFFYKGVKGGNVLAGNGVK